MAKTNKAKAPVQQFKHDEKNVYKASGIDEKEFDAKVESYNEKMREDGNDKTSERVELMTQIFTPVELAFLFVSYQNREGRRSKVRQMLAELMDDGD